MDNLHLNCDMGEGLENEAALMPFIQAANIACGGHAGDADTMERVMRLALTHDVEVGIHPAYPDRENFGRKKMNIPIAELQNAWQQQFETFLSCCQIAKCSVSHIKAHGALYHALSADEALSSAFLQTCLQYLPQVKMFAAPNSAFIAAAEAAGFTVMPEGFADRGYSAQGELLKRGEAGAIIHSAEKMAEQVAMMWQEKKVKATTGEIVPLTVKTICVHGDHPHTLRNLQYLLSQFNSTQAP